MSFWTTKNEIQGQQFSWPLLLVGVALAILLTFTIYRQALTGSFHFDDAPNLEGLASASDLASSIFFVFGGKAGPLGRPIALLSFLPQAEAWPDHPRPFLVINLVIHLANGVLIAALSYQLTRLLGDRLHQPTLFVITVTLLWLILPINAPASLLVIQRMTTLAAFFMLVGLLTYTVGRLRLEKRPRSGIILMTLAVVTCTPLAALTKENGILLPIYALVLEATLFSSFAAPIPRFARVWRRLFLVFPTLLIAGFLAYRSPPLLESDASLSSGLYSRLTTQAFALIDYLHILVAPTPFAIHPFYDDYQPAALPISAIAGSLVFGGLAGAIGFSVWQRRKFPVLTFAILWFLAGHSLESSVLPLEPFYLHRNYVPSFGITLLLVYFFFAKASRISNILRVLLLPYLILVIFVLAESAYTWGRPDLAGELWLINRPSSTRASEFLATRYRQRGDYATAARILRESHAQTPDATGTNLQYLGTFCQDSRAEVTRRLIRDIEEILRRGTYTKRTSQQLDSLVAAWQRGNCPLLDPASLHALLDALLDNAQTYRWRIEAHNLHLIRFRLYLSEHDFNNAISSLTRAYGVYPGIETLRLLAEVLESGGLHEDAIKFIEQAAPPATINPITARIWRARIDALRVRFGSDANSSPR